MSKITRFKIIVSGKVQGVGFRYHTKLKAESLGLSGYVQNQSTGSVYIEAEGSEDLLTSLIDWTKYGPDSADVSGVEVQEIEPIGGSHFLIRK